MTHIGFLGLGAMGAAMARRFVAPGHRVTVWNRSPEPVQALVRAETIRGNAATEAIAVSVIISRLADDSAIESAFTPEGLKAVPEGALRVDMASAGRRVIWTVSDWPGAVWGSEFGMSARS
jgi:3-hydroxyisobutyrate dehydrogenase-like beta-hydroxyacid dehydrogenase